MAAFYEQCLSVHMKIPIFRDDDGDVIKNVVTMATVAMVMIGLSRKHLQSWRYWVGF